MTPKEKAIKQLEEKVIIEHNGDLAYLAIVHGDYGSPSAVDEYIIAELKKLDAMHLVSDVGGRGKDYFIKDDIDEVRSNKDYILAVLRAKKVVEKIEEATDINGRTREVYYESKDYDKHMNLRYCNTTKKRLYVVDLNSRLVIDEYDGMENVEGGGYHIWDEDEMEKMKKLVEAEYS